MVVLQQVCCEQGKAEFMELAICLLHILFTGGLLRTAFITTCKYIIFFISVTNVTFSFTYN